MDKSVSLQISRKQKTHSVWLNSIQLQGRGSIPQYSLSWQSVPGTDIVVKALSQDLLDDDQLSAQLIVDGRVIDKTQLVGKEPMQPLWRLKDNLNM